MKRNDCSIVQDLLPLYIEDMLRPDTAEYVADHLSGCEVCTAALGDLKAETASPVLTPDTEEIRQGDKKVLKKLKKSLTQRDTVIWLTVIYVLLYLFPWFTKQQAKAASNLFLLIFVFFPLYLAIAMFFRRDPLSRNTAIAVSGVILPVAGLPLFLFINAFYGSLYDAFYGHNYTGLYPYETLWQWFTASFSPALLLVIICGILLTVVSLRNIWRNVVPPQKPSSSFARYVSILTLCLSGLIVALHCVPWMFIHPHRSHGISPLDFNYLFYEWILIYVATAIAFCEVTSRKRAIMFSICSLALPGYLYYYWLSAFGADRIWSWNVPETEWFYPFDKSLLLGLYCLLSATAICSVWYKLKRQAHQE